MTKKHRAGSAILSIPIPDDQAGQYDRVRAASKNLTEKLGGRWFGDVGSALCPYCEHGRLSVYVGNSAPIFDCTSDCDRRVLAGLFRKRGWLQ